MKLHEADSSIELDAILDKSEEISIFRQCHQFRFMTFKRI